MSKGLTRQRIVAAALELLDEEGIDRLTVRALAQRLDVKPPALYWHVRDKQELLDEMGTEIQRRVNAAIDRLPADIALEPGLAEYARILRREYLEHRDGARTFSGTRITDPVVLRAQEPWLERWVGAGVSLTDVVDAAELVTSFVVGFVIEEQERSQSSQERYSVDVRDEALGQGVPLVVAAGHVRGDGESRFERQLGIVLDGVAGLLRA